MRRYEARTAEEDIRSIDIGFPSWDGESTIHGMVWYPTGEPVGIVQLIHGMSEHISRYDPFARFLASRGFVVGGHDHIGHGLSVSSQSDLGHMPTEGGADILVGDVHTMRQILQGAFPEAPYFIFGHSMGSFTLRVYLARRGAGLAGAILCGTGNKPTAVALAGNRIAKIGARVRGEKAKSNLVHTMADGAFSRSVPDARTEFDWISADRDNVDDYIADDLNGFQFTLGGYASLMQLVYLAANLELAKCIPNELPLLFVSGAKDPVGDNGQGVREAAQLMRDAGAYDVDVILYDGMRHEILNETESRVVFDDILAWIEAVLSVNRGRSKRSSML